MTRAFDVAGVGTNSVDHVLMLAESLQRVSETGKSRVAVQHRFFGGQTATAVCACAALGLRARYVGVFGSDEDGQLMREALHARGIDTSAAVKSDGLNRQAVILVYPDGRRTVLWHRPDHLTVAASRMGAVALDARVLHLDDDDPGLALAAARAAAASQMEITADLEHAGDATEQLIAAVTYPIFEQTFPARITGESDPERALRKLRRITPNLMCVTLGDAGAAALEGDRFHHSPAFAVDAVDTTGAGDVFRGAFIYGLLQGWDVPARLRFANAAAAVSCTRLGAIPSVPNLAEVEELLGGSPSVSVHSR